MGKAFEKQIKRLEALKDLKPEKQMEVIKYKPKENNNRSRATIIFDNLINKRVKIINELYESVDKNKLYLEYVGPT